MAIGNLPQGKNARVSWSINFEAEFPALADDLGFTPDETTELVNYVINLRFNILRSQKALAFSKACSKYKNEMLDGLKKDQDPSAFPVYNDIRPPDPLAQAGIVPFINTAIRRMKLSKNYSPSIAQTLMIAPVKEPPTALAVAKPAAQASTLADFIVRLEWVKAKFDGVVIESQRGEETVWSRLDRDFRSPFDDERAPVVAGKSEERRYRLRYFVDDRLIGEWSDVILVIARP